jgi:hypothetical protein
MQTAIQKPTFAPLARSTRSRAPVASRVRLVTLAQKEEKNLAQKVRMCGEREVSMSSLQ